MKITQRMKDTWIANLRSGEIKQVRNDWHHGDGSCCLDVLCLQETGVNYTNLGPNDPATLLMREIGLGINDRVVDRLIVLNDEEEYNFDQIADWIEENVDAVEG